MTTSSYMVMQCRHAGSLEYCCDDDISWKHLKVLLPWPPARCCSASWPAAPCVSLHCTRFKLTLYPDCHKFMQCAWGNMWYLSGCWGPWGDDGVAWCKHICTFQVGIQAQIMRDHHLSSERSSFSSGSLPCHHICQGAWFKAQWATL